jgi:hypothetical protein
LVEARKSRAPGGRAHAAASGSPELEREIDGTGDERMSMATDKAKVTKAIIDALKKLDLEEKDGEKQFQIRAEAMVEYALDIYGLNRIFPKTEYIVTMSDILAAYERGDECYEP